MTRQDDGTNTRQDLNTPAAGNTGQPGSKDMASWKPGSEAAEARNVGGKGDFGVPAGSGPTLDRQYVSENTKASDPGAAKPRSSEFEGVRTGGAGAAFEGDGSGSEGDLDPDVLGIGTGSGLAATGPGDAPGPDDSDGSSDEFASGGHAQGRNQTLVGKVGGDKRVRGSVVSRDLDLTTGADGQTSDNLNNPARGDDSFATEVTLGEALGEDNAMSPSSDTQGLSDDDNQSQDDSEPA